jgi:hypothetical protein
MHPRSRPCRGTIRRKGIDANEIQLVDLDGVLPVDARVAVKYASLPVRGRSGIGVRSQSDPLTSERDRDLLNVEPVQVEHPFSVRTTPGAWKRDANEVLGPLVGAWR